MSFSHLATIGTLSYNGVTFDGASSVKVNVEFVKDDAGRTVVYSRHSIEAHTFFSDSASTDGQLENIRTKLNHQGGALVFVNKGFGDDLIVNAAGGGGLRDVKWGPVPETLYWEPVGSAGACEVIWKVTTCVPCCGQGASDRTSGVMAINYGVDISLDIRGLSTRTISGYIEICMTRGPGKTVPDSADNYRYLIQTPQPDGFQREQNWSIEPDKSRVVFTITDKQIPSKNPYPPGVTNIRGRHTSAWQRAGRKTNQLRESISMEVELAMGRPSSAAYAIFGQLVKARVDYAARQGIAALLDEVVAEEDIWGLGYSFGCSYRQLMTDAAAINQSYGEQQNASNPAPNPALYDVSKTGMWQPTTGSGGWGLWRASMQDVFGNRGFAGLTVSGNNDVIVDLCGTGFTISDASAKPPPLANPGLVPIIANRKPPPAKSYLTFKQRFAIRHQKYVARQRTKQAADKPGATGNLISTEPMNFKAAAAQSSSSTPTADVLQESGTGSYSVAYIGSAMRAGYEVPRPSIKSIGGQTPIETDGIFQLEQVGNWFGCPIFEAKWAITYELPSAPNNVSGPPKLEA